MCTNLERQSLQFVELVPHDLSRHGKCVRNITITEGLHITLADELLAAPPYSKNEFRKKYQYHKNNQ
jgi:hypothetical protein